MRYTADFETTTQEEDCRVWAWGVYCIDKVEEGIFDYGTDIDSFMNWCEREDNHILYFHNLKFDGQFILYWLFSNGFVHIGHNETASDKTFKTLISNTNQFYSIEVFFEVNGRKNNKVTFYDSMKLLPFSVDRVATSFGLPLSKLEIDYTLKREYGHKLTGEELRYLRHDVEIVARALAIMFSEEITKMTIASNALFNFKRMMKSDFREVFPIPEYDGKIRIGYRGGFTYLSPKYANKIVNGGIVLDVNSLYPSVMAKKPLPFGKGIYFEGEYKDNPRYPLYIQYFSCNFKVKEGHIPTVQLKNNIMFCSTEYLTDCNGEDVSMCMTCIDLELFLEHYEVVDLQFHWGYMFRASNTIFRRYVEHWTAQKTSAKAEGNQGMYTIAKLMQNSLYGKFATNPSVESKIPYLDVEKDVVAYKRGDKEERTPVYLPVAMFITSWARYITISSAQKLYDRFIYADTDSLHLEGTEIPDCLYIDDYDLGAWKLETIFSKAKYIRAKSYLMEVVKDNNPFVQVTCAGMPYNIHKQVSFENFKIGARYSGKLSPKRVAGGVVLRDVDFTITKV